MSFQKISQTGFSLVEILIAAAVIATTLVSVVGISSQSISVSRQSLNTYTATTLLEEGAEVVRTVRDMAWSNISGLTVGANYYPLLTNAAPYSWSLSTLPSASVVGIFTRSVVISDVYRNGSDDIVSSGGTLDPNTKLVVVKVTWLENNTTVNKTLSFYLMKIFPL